MINWFSPFIEFLGGVSPTSWLVSVLAFAILAALFLWLRRSLDV